MVQIASTFQFIYDFAIISLGCMTSYSGLGYRPLTTCTEVEIMSTLQLFSFITKPLVFYYRKMVWEIMKIKGENLSDEHFNARVKEQMKFVDFFIELIR